MKTDYRIGDQGRLPGECFFDKPDFFNDSGSYKNQQSIMFNFSTCFFVIFLLRNRLRKRLQFFFKQMC